MPDDKRPQTVEVARYLGLGLSWAVSTAVFLYLGSWADRWLGSKPALTMAGAFIGAAAGFYYLYHELTKATRDGNRPDSNKH